MEVKSKNVILLKYIISLKRLYCGFSFHDWEARVAEVRLRVSCEYGGLSRHSMNLGDYILNVFW